MEVHHWASNYCEADIDEEGNFYCMAQFRDTIHFDQWQIIPEGMRDMYVARYDNDGQVNWVKTIEGTSGANTPYGMAVYDTNNLFIGGYFANQIFAGEKEVYTTSSRAGFLTHIGDSIIYTSIGEENISNLLVLIYPNPAHDLLYLDFKLPTREVLVELSDLNGHQIKTRVLKNVSGTQKLDLNGLPKGMYLLRVTADGKTSSGKVVIQ